MPEASKAAKKYFRKLAAVAHERELSNALEMGFARLRFLLASESRLFYTSFPPRVPEQTVFTFLG